MQCGEYMYFKILNDTGVLVDAIIRLSASDILHAAQSAYLLLRYCA
eukprot:SAG11_NODE_21144_length_431_cov_0.915663_2_plen_45_part_01